MYTIHEDEIKQFHRSVKETGLDAVAVVKKSSRFSIEKNDLVAKPIVKLATAETFSLTEAKEERLSEIIAEINSRTGSRMTTTWLSKQSCRFRIF